MRASSKSAQVENLALDLERLLAQKNEAAELMPFLPPRRQQSARAIVDFGLLEHGKL